MGIGATPKTILQFHPLAYLGERGRDLGRRLTLYDIPDAFLNWIRARGFDAIWMVGVWERGQDSRRRLLEDLGSMGALRHFVPDVEPSEVLGGPFAIHSYVVPEVLGGEAALADLRHRMNERGLSLVLDFVANHTTRDCPWLGEHPSAYVRGIRGVAPDEDCFTHRSAHGLPEQIAFGRDPYFPGWEQTAQLDIRSAKARSLLSEAIVSVAARCDGIHCNTAMLGLEDVFNSTWGAEGSPWKIPQDKTKGELWAELIHQVRSEFPQTWLIAEAYWGKEYQLQDLGFDHVWDKLLYDRLRDGDAPSLREHLRGEQSFQNRCMRFLENHFQDRAAVTFHPKRHRAALALTLGGAGVTMISYGQLLGARSRQPLSLQREPQDQPNRELPLIYESLCRALNHPAIRDGEWQLLDDSLPPQEGDVTALFAMQWRHPSHGVVLILVNFGDIPISPRVCVHLGRDIHGRFRVRDRLGTEEFESSAWALSLDGITYDLEPWAVRVFELFPSG